MDKTVISSFDPAAHLDADGQQFLLDNALGSDDPAYLAHAIGTIARSKGGLLAIERRTGIKRQTLAKSFGAGGNPTLGTLLPLSGFYIGTLPPRRRADASMICA